LSSKQCHDQVTYNSNLECQRIEHSQEIKTFIFNQNIDILLVPEISLTRVICISGYTLYYTDPDSKTHGGTALIIRNSIRHYEIGTKENSCRLAPWSKTEMVVLLFQSYTHRIL